MISLPPQVKKVQDFYNEKTDEISQRLEVLVESVDTSGLKPKEHKRRKSMVKTFTSKFEEILQGSGKRGSIQVSNLPDIRDILAQESMDDEDEKANQKKRDEMMRKSDSIKRAITDVYRTSKLLHNYSIMVSMICRFSRFNFTALTILQTLMLYHLFFE
jgi:hypothetical protein